MNIKDIKIGMRVNVIGTHPCTPFGQGVVIKEELANDLNQGGIVDKDTRQWHYSANGRWMIELDNNPFDFEPYFSGNELHKIEEMK